jgi:hypothetical protein
MSTEREFTYEEYREEYLKKHRENLALKDRILELEKQNEIIRADRVNTTEQLESELGALRAELANRDGAIRTLAIELRKRTPLKPEDNPEEIEQYWIDYALSEAYALAHPTEIELEGSKSE